MQKKISMYNSKLTWGIWREGNMPEANFSNINTSNLSEDGNTENSEDVENPSALDTIKAIWTFKQNRMFDFYFYWWFIHTEKVFLMTNLWKQVPENDFWKYNPTVSVLRSNKQTVWKPWSHIYLYNTLRGKSIKGKGIALLTIEDSKRCFFFFSHLTLVFHWHFCFLFVCFCRNVTACCWGTRTEGWTIWSSFATRRPCGTKKPRLMCSTSTAESPRLRSRTSRSFTTKTVSSARGSSFLSLQWPVERQWSWHHNKNHNIQCAVSAEHKNGSIPIWAWKHTNDFWSTAHQVSFLHTVTHQYIEYCCSFKKQRKTQHK